MNTNKIEDPSRKIALITGCSSGFGLLAAIEMARAGFTVFASMRNLTKRVNLDSAAAKAGVAVNVIELDVTKESSIAQAVNHINSTAGPIDVLVNNAGIAISGFAEESSLDETRTIFETNFFGLIATTKAVYPQMRERHSGHIINISSGNGKVGTPLASGYSSSKFAVEGYSEALRYEAGMDGICVSLVEPGFFKTELLGLNRRLAAKALDPGSPHYQPTKLIGATVQANMDNKQDPLEVATIIVKIATSPTPHLRYVVGNDMKKNLFLKAILPTALYEKILMKLMLSGKKL